MSKMTLDIVGILVLCVCLSSAVAVGSTKLSLWGGFPEVVPFSEKVVEDYQKLHPDVEIEILAYDLRIMNKTFSYHSY